MDDEGIRGYAKKEDDSRLLAMYMEALIGPTDLREMTREWDDRWDYERRPEEWIPALDMIMMMIKRVLRR